MLQKTRAVVLHTIKYGDTSLIVHAITEAWGRRSFLLKGVRKSKKNNRSNMFQPLFFLDLDIYFRDTREIQWIKEAAYSGSVPVYGDDLVKTTQAMFLSEVLMKTIREEEKNTDLFNFLSNTLKYFNSNTKSISSYHILFLFQFTRLLGFYPQNNSSSINTFFDPLSASFSGTPSSADIELEMLLSEHWKKSFSADYISADQHFINQEVRNKFLDSLLNFYQLHQQSMNDLKSLEVLRTVFS
jgi:DNA repair protein RecO (recombination protein O)